MSAHRVMSPHHLCNGSGSFIGTMIVQLTGVFVRAFRIQRVCSIPCVDCEVSVVDECFFFSSRRRHTRCSRDWSSDVCSSDLIRMAPRFYEPKRGAILMDGVPITRFTRTSLRGLMGIVSQETILLNDTVLANKIGRASCRERV